MSLPDRSRGSAIRTAVAARNRQRIGALFAQMGMSASRHETAGALEKCLHSAPRLQDFEICVLRSNDRYASSS